MGRGRSRFSVPPIAETLLPPRRRRSETQNKKHHMTTLEIKGDWNITKGKLKQKWAQLTDDGRISVSCNRRTQLSSRSEAMTVAVGFSPRWPQRGVRVAERRLNRWSAGFSLSGGDTLKRGLQPASRSDA